MKTKQKICVDCKHFAGGYDKFCNRYAEEVKQIDPVSGIVTVYTVGGIRADRMREPDNISPYHFKTVKMPDNFVQCGPEGTLWEAKDMAYYLDKLKNKFNQWEYDYKRWIDNEGFGWVAFVTGTLILAILFLIGILILSVLAIFG